MLKYSFPFGCAVLQRSKYYFCSPLVKKFEADAPVNLWYKPLLRCQSYANEFAVRCDWWIVPEAIRASIYQSSAAVHLGKGNFPFLLRALLFTRAYFQFRLYILSKFLFPYLPKQNMMSSSNQQPQV